MKDFRAFVAGLLLTILLVLIPLAFVDFGHGIWVVVESGIRPLAALTAATCMALIFAAHVRHFASEVSDVVGFR